MIDKIFLGPAARLGSQKFVRRPGHLSSLSFQLSSASGVLALTLAASMLSPDVALASCTVTGTPSDTKVVCSGTTNDDYHAPRDTKASVEVKADARMTPQGAAIRVRGESSVTISDGATITVDGKADSTDGAFNAIYAGGSQSTLTNNGTISTSQDSVDGMETTADETTKIGKNTLINTGRISTQGTSSEAMIARGDDNTLRNSGTIQTSGESARGLIAEGHNNTLVNTSTGVISTTNRGGEGIRADGGRPNGPTRMLLLARMQRSSTRAPSRRPASPQTASA
jgi:hypothetical protein